MSDSMAIVGIAPCGCIRYAMCLPIPHDVLYDHERDLRRMRQRGYVIETWPDERIRTSPWLCPEHKALRERLAREKAEPGR